MEIVLGSAVKDVITGFEGIVTARSIHMNGCDRYWIEPTVDKEGKRRDGAWSDVTTLEVTSKEPVKLPDHGEKKEARKPGGFTSSIK